MKKNRSKGLKALKVFSIILILIIICLISVFLSIYYSVNLDENAVVAKKADVMLFSAAGKEIANDNISRYIAYEDISPNIINAFVALEDKRFWSHGGVDYYRTAGALIHNLKVGYIKEGGSTITQQLAKNTQLSGEKTAVRKIKEMRLAREIEKRYSKEKILEYYLNAIYFGNGVYGVDSACRTYYNKSASEVGLSEGAYLAGLVKSPNNYSPLKNTQKATERKNLVLKLMLEQGYLDESEYRREVDYVFQSPKENFEPSSPYYLNALVESGGILNLSEKTLMENGYKIYTYYDETSQNILYNAHISGEFACVNSNGNAASYAAMLADNKSGGISAYFANFGDSLYTFRRQPASAVKPILVYAPALESKTINPATPVLDERVNINGYSPQNYGGNYLGWTDLQTAINVSSNTVSVKTMNDTGIGYSKSIAEKMGLTFSENDNGLSIALGGMENGVSFAELSSGYMCLANGGKYIKNTFIRAIYDKNNRLVYLNDAMFSQAISQESAYLLTDMLCDTAKHGTARKLSALGITIAGKTGTNGHPKVSDNLDAWCASYTPSMTSVVWYGSLDNSAEKAVATTGGVYPALLSQYIYKSLQLEDQSFAVPDGIISLDIDKYALDNERKVYLANNFTPFECVKSLYFDENNAPYEYSPYFDFDKFEFEAVNIENAVMITLNEVKPYQTKLCRRDMYTNELMEIPLDGTGAITDAAEKYGVYSYYVEFYYNGKALNYTPSKLVFT